MDKVGKYTLEVMKKAKWYNGWLLSFFDTYLKGDILEVGAGIGNFTKLLAKYGEVTGIDINKDYLGKRFPHESGYHTEKDSGLCQNDREKDSGLCQNDPSTSSGLRQNNGLVRFKVRYGDVEKGKYFFKNKKFDTIVCLNVLEHIKDDKKALDNMYGLLNNNGKLVLLVPSHNLLYSKYDKLLGHFRRYNISKLISKIRCAGFETVDVRYINWWGALGWLFYLKLLNKEEFPEKEVGIFDILGRIFLWPEKFVKPRFGLSVLAMARRN